MKDNDVNIMNTAVNSLIKFRSEVFLMQSLGKKNANAIVNDYNLGEVKSIERLKKGYYNLNYKVTTPEGVFVLKINKEKPEEEIKYEIKVIEELKKIDFPAAYPIKRSDTKYISDTEFGKVVVYPFIEGEEPKPSQETVGEIAKVIARLNSFKDWESIRMDNIFYSLDRCWEIIGKFDQSKIKYPELFDYFTEETELLSEALSQELPEGLVHCDCFTDNTIFQGNKLAALLDFEAACTDKLMFDIGTTINGFCFEDNKLNLKLLDVFLKEYDRVRTISRPEIKLLPHYTRWGAHAPLSWHLNEILNGYEERKFNRANELMARVTELRKVSY